MIAETLTLIYKELTMEKSFSQRVKEATQAVKSLSPQEAKKHKIANPHTVFVDPRDNTDIEATTGIIPGAINVSLGDLNSDCEKTLPDALRSRTQTVIASCQGGPMGAIAAHELMKRGYTNVFYVEGGTQNWLDAGYATA